MKKRTMLASLFAALALTATAGVGGMLTNTASAEISGLGTFKIEDGASVRITGTDDIHDGLRFQVKMDATTVAKIVGETSVSGVTGTDTNDEYKLWAVIAPADVVTNNDFTNVAAEHWVEIDENKIYYSTEHECYYANAVLTNVRETNRYRAYTMGAVIKNGTDSVWAAPANEGYQTRSLYQTVNLATLSADEDTAKIINNADTTYKSWLGKDGYPLVVTTEAQLNSIITDVTGNKYSFAEKNIYVDSAVKATETYTNAVAQDGALNALAAELDATYYDVTFKADADTALYTYKAKSGATAVWNGWSFSKPADGLNNTYTNNGWDAELGAVNANVTYTAEYSAAATDVKNGVGLAAFKDMYWEKTTIKGETKTALRVANLPADRCDVALLSTGDYAWAEGKALTFTAYNNSSEYEYTFMVEMLDDTTGWNVYSITSACYTVEPNETQTVTIYAEDFDSSTTKYVRIAVSHYSTAAAQSWSVVPQGAEDTSDLMGFDLSFYDFKFGDKAKPVTDDYIQAANVTGSAFLPSVNSNKNYVNSGDYSLAMTLYGTSGIYAYLDFARDNDWSKATNLTFQVYNPYTSDYRIYADLTDGDTTTASGLCKTTIDLAPQEWTEVTISTVGKEIKENSAVRISTAWNEGNNEILDGTTFTSANNTKWRAFRLYFDSFEFEEVLNVKKGNFTSVVAETKTINGAEKEVITISGITPSVDRYPATHLYDYSNLAWADGKALTFSVYNNSSEYEFTFQVVMLSANEGITDDNRKNICFATVEPNETQEVTIYAEDFDYNIYKYFVITTNHYYTSNGNANVSPQDDVSTGELDLANFNISVYDFTFEDKSKPATEDYKQAASVIGASANVSVNTNENYVKNGDYSLVYNSYGARNYVGLEFTREYDWSAVESVSFWIYNPYSSAYWIIVGYHGDACNANGCSNKLLDKTALMPNQWTKVTVVTQGTAIAEGNALCLHIDKDLKTDDAAYGNTGVGTSMNTVKWRAFRLYVDDFSVINGDGTSEELLWTKGSGSARFMVNTDSKYLNDSGKYSVRVNVTGTWNTFYLTQGLNITSASKLSFDVYNPSGFDMVISVGSTAYVVLKNTWKTISVTDVASAITADKGLKIAVNHTSSATIDGVKYTNPTKGAEGDLWRKGMYEIGFYLDNFVIS